MNLIEALTQSRPLPPTRQMARTSLPGKGTVVVIFDGWWGVTYQGSPFPFWSRGDVMRFLKREGIPLQGGWMPQIAGSVAASRRGYGLHSVG